MVADMAERLATPGEAVARLLQALPDVVDDTDVVSEQVDRQVQSRAWQHVLLRLLALLLVVAWFRLLVELLVLVELLRLLRLGLGDGLLGDEVGPGVPQRPGVQERLHPPPARGILHQNIVDELPQQ